MKSALAAHLAPLLLGACALTGPGARPPPVAPSSAEALAAVKAAAGALMQADAPRALAALREVPAVEFAGRDAEFRACVIERLGGDAPSASGVSTPGPFARGLLAAYRAYWWRVLTRSGTRESEEARLLHAARELLGAPAVEETSEALEPLVAARLRSEGLHALQGRTAPLLELMLWTREEERRYDVALPETSHATRVLLLDGFLSLGWAEWATCGRHSAGGWASADVLRAVRPRYRSLDGEEFRVTFLGHETQHLSDLERHPGLASWELEYRAKLTELALAVETRGKLLDRFEESQGDDPDVPHAYANRRVLADLRARLGLAPGADLAKTSVPALQQAAAAVLRDDSRRREAGRAR
jgi:hypothetical protein